MRHSVLTRRSLATVLAVAAFVLPKRLQGADRSGVCPGWLPKGAVSPFFPDDAYTLHAPGCKQAYFRKTFKLGGGPRRAVLAVTGWHTVGVWLNGTLVAEYHGGSPDRVPRFVDVTAQLRAGENGLDVRVWSQWSPTFYAQLRIEQPDDSFVDVSTDASWEAHPGAAEGWPRGRAPAAGWQAVEVVDDYYGSAGRGKHWANEYALLPRPMLRKRLGAFNDRLRASWAKDRAREPSRFRREYLRPDYAAQYGRFLRIDPVNGQVVDATGKVRHLFFTIYRQTLKGKSPLNWVEYDFDRLEEDLALMERAAVHPYVRFLGWALLLDAEGNWRRCETQPAGTGLPQFTWNYEVLDYFLDRCEAHGRFVAVECDFFWSASWETLPAPYHTRYYLYPEVTEASGLAHRKILSRYAERSCIAGFMIGEEEIQMAHDLDNPHLHTAFVEHLRGRYGTLGDLARAWGRGYDFADRSEWREAERPTSRWGTTADGAVREAVLLPRHPLRDEMWAGVSEWSQLRLPVWPTFRWTEPPYTELLSHQPFPGDAGDLDDDPVWIDYNAFREDVLYLNSVSRWAEIVREAVPNHWFQHSNAQDFTAQWHFIHFHRRAELPFDVMGVGSHDSGKGLSEIPLSPRVRKYVRNIASYRPYVLAPGSPAVGVASGEGEGGRPGDEDGILDYYRGQSMELVGHGAAFELSYAWPHLSGAAEAKDGRSRMTKALDWMGSFYRAVDGVTFSLRREVPVLIMRNGNLQRSNRSGRDYGNAVALAASIAQLNVEFDVVMDQDCVYGEAERKVDLGAYRVIFLPCVECDYRDGTWQELDSWLSDAAYRGQRMLVVGYVGKRTPYLTPRAAFHPVLAGWLGQSDYADSVRLRGSNEYDWAPLGRTAQAGRIRIHFGERSDITPVGVFGAGAAVLSTADGKPLGTRVVKDGNSVCAFGFPLGLAFDNLWGLPAGMGNGKPAGQEPYDVMASLYEDLLEAAGVPRPIRAPHNVRVAASDDHSIILVRELCGTETRDLCTLVLPKGVSYDGCELVPQDDGRTLVRAQLGPYGGLVLKRTR